MSFFGCVRLCITMTPVILIFNFIFGDGYNKIIGETQTSICSVGLKFRTALTGCKKWIVLAVKRKKDMDCTSISL